MKQEAVMVTKGNRKGVHLSETARLRLTVFFKNKFAVAGAILTLLLILFAVLGASISPNYNYTFNPELSTLRRSAPTAQNWFGVDDQSRDLYSCCVFGVRISLMVGFFVSICATVFGVILGLLAGYFKFLDNILMRICDALTSIPAILLALIFVAIFGPGISNIIIALTVIYTPAIARVARASTLSVREMTYIEACGSVGARWPRILFRHILPNIMSPIIVQTTFIFASSIIVEASLSFLGVGIPSDMPSLGRLIYEAKSVSIITTAPYLTFIPGAIMVLLVLGINLLGDGLRDMLDSSSH